MINILPYNYKQELRAAHSNVVLIKYLMIIGLGMAFLAFITIGVYFILMDIKTNADNVISLNQEKSSSYSDTQKQATTLKASLANAKSILDSEVRYTKLLTTIASLMPNGTIIDSLTLSNSLFTSSTTLSVYAKSTDVALKLKNNFQSSSLFSGVSFQSLTGESATKASGYPITAVVNLTFNKDAIK